jgi:hypothetical protein
LTSRPRTFTVGVQSARLDSARIVHRPLRPVPVLVARELLFAPRSH